MITKIPAKIENWVITPLVKIKKNPSNVFIYLEYPDINNQKINLKNITWIIDKDYSEEYKEKLLNKYN